MWKSFSASVLTPEACSVSDRSLVLRPGQISPVDIWMESFRSCVLKTWCEIQTWGNLRLKWNGIPAQFCPKSYIMSWSVVIVSWYSPRKSSCEQMCEVCFQFIVSVSTIKAIDTKCGSHVGHMEFSLEKKQQLLFHPIDVEKQCLWMHRRPIVFLFSSGTATILPSSHSILYLFISVSIWSFQLSPLPPISSQFPTSSFLYSGHLLPIHPVFLRHIQHVQLLCHRQAQTPRFWPPFNRHAAHRPIQTALIGSDSKYVPWNWLGMHMRGCVRAPPRVGSCDRKKGAFIVRKTEQKRERDKDLEKEWRCEASGGIAALYPLSENLEMFKKASKFLWMERLL